MEDDITILELDIRTVILAITIKIKENRNPGQRFTNAIPKQMVME